MHVDDHYFTFVLEEAHNVFEHEYDSILSFFLVHVPRFRVNNTGGPAAIPLCSFFVLITGNRIVLHDGRNEKKNRAQGKYNKEGKRKGAERGNLCPKRFTRKRITGMAEKGDQNKMGM
jgi:hypothetical protein